MLQFDNTCKPKDELTLILLYSQGGLKPIILPPALTNRKSCIAKSIASCFSRDTGGVRADIIAYASFNALKKVKAVDIMCFPTQDGGVEKRGWGGIAYRSSKNPMGKLAHNSEEMQCFSDFAILSYNKIEKG